MFIVTYIDPKSAKSGPFNKWFKTVGKTFFSLFIKIAIVSIMLLLISLIDQVSLPSDAGAWGKLLLLLGVLIFAKKAPKWIGDMIGVEGGMGDLGIGKKLSNAALIGGGISKGLEGAKKFTGQKAKNFAANRLRNTAARVGGMKEAHDYNKQLKKTGGSTSDKKSLWEQGRAAAKTSRQANWGKDAQGAFKDISQGYMSGRLNLNPSAESLNEKLRGKAEVEARLFNDRVGNSQEEMQKRKEEANKLKTSSQMRMDTVTLDANGKRDTKVNWQGYNEFQNAIGSDVMTEQQAYEIDMKNKARAGFRDWKLDSSGNVVDSKGNTLTWEDNKKTFTVAGQKDVSSFITKNFQNQSESLKRNVDIRVSNDQKIAQYDSQIAQYDSQIAQYDSQIKKLKDSGVPDTDDSIKSLVTSKSSLMTSKSSLESLKGQLVAQNNNIIDVNKQIIQNINSSEATFAENPQKCPTAVKINDDTYKTATGTFEKDLATGKFVYKPSLDLIRKTGETDTAYEARINEALGKFNFDPTVINEIMNKVANVANKTDKEASEAHTAMEPKKN